MRARKGEGVGYTTWILFHDVMNPLTRQASSDVLCDLSNEAVGDDRDVLDASAPDGAQRIVDDWPLVDGEQGLLRVTSKRRQAAAVTARNEDGSDVHGPPTIVMFKAPPVQEVC